ncbi:hypothetical protein JCM24511_08005 [Saitozyma sp. JCM 24511]|nr:hypothetical protein JCM24511_08005 [Saitozyma sp. JCM 24511]
MGMHRSQRHTVAYELSVCAFSSRDETVEEEDMAKTHDTKGRQSGWSSSTLVTPTRPSLVSAETRLEQLEEEVASLRAQLGGRDADEVVQRHIKLLHTYNEIKDGAQRLIGAMSQKTITAVHEELGLSLTE